MTSTPPKTAYGVMLREGARMARQAGHPGVLGSRIAEHLPHARTIVIDPEQALAVVDALADEMAMTELAEVVRAPFANTLLDFRHGVPHEGGALVGALCTSSLATYMILMRRTKDGHIEFNEYRPEVFSAIADHDPGCDCDKSRSARIGVVPYAALGLLESANVSLVESSSPYPRGHVAHGRPKFDIHIRQSRRSVPGDGDGDGTASYSHRFEVRGNFAHHYELTAAGGPNRLFERWSVEKPEKVVQIGGKPCIRIWRPPYVKGPEDAPLIPKIRHLGKGKGTADGVTTEEDA